MAQAFLLAVSELAGNAVEHGKSETGAYVAAQRYQVPESRLVLSIADLGIGIPEHLRQQYPEWREDEVAIRHATEEAVSGTGSTDRGYGFSQVLEEVEASRMRYANLTIRSGRGTVRATVDGGGITRTGVPTPYKRLQLVRQGRLVPTNHPMIDAGSIPQSPGAPHMRISLAEHGRAFSTRPLGATLLGIVLKEVANDAEVVEVDFTGVRSVSYSFADQFIGDLLQRRAAGEAEFELVLTNVATPLRRVICRSLENRGLSIDYGELFGQLPA